jgi:hypothetical protein
VNHGLIVKQAPASVGGRVVYSLGASAALLLQGLGEYCLIGPRRLARGNSESSLLHALELNDIQLSLLQAGPGQKWIPACEIRSQNVLTHFGFAKDYDAACGPPKRMKSALSPPRKPGVQVSPKNGFPLSRD